MRNTKELKAILTAIHCINFVHEHRDEDICNLLEYAFRKCFDSTTNIFIFACVGQTKESIMPQIKELLEQETEYAKFIENKRSELWKDTCFITPTIKERLSLITQTRTAINPNTVLLDIHCVNR